MSAGYQLLFRIAFEHLFFADGKLKGMRVAPSEACRELLRRAGVLLRAEQDGMAAYADGDTLARLRLHLDEAGGVLGMAFLVFATDPYFAEYTLPVLPRGHVLVFDTAGASEDASGRRMLHATPFVAASALMALDDKSLEPELGKRAAVPAPCMLIRLALTASLLDEPQRERRAFYARFDAASSYWKYWLFGVASDTTASIADLGGDMQFDHVRGVELADDRRADVFVSRREIAMRERPEARFQLRASTPSGDKVLIKRMPNASLGKRFRETRDGSELLVSEIFINQ